MRSRYLLSANGSTCSMRAGGAAVRHREASWRISTIVQVKRAGRRSRNEASPSRASSLAASGAISARRRASAASSSCSASRDEASVARTPIGACSAITLAPARSRAPAAAPARRPPAPALCAGLGGVELIAGEQPAHGVSPTGLARKADRRAADRVDAALHSICANRASPRRRGCRSRASARCRW